MKKERLDLIIIALAIGMAVYHLANCYISLVGSIEHRIIHLGSATILIYVTSLKTSKRSWLSLVLILATLLSFSYIWVNLERLLFDMGFPVTADVVVGFIILIVVFVACWLSFGFILPLMAVLLLVYGFFSQYLGGPILSVEEIITTVCLTFGSYDLWGKILGISANVIFLFILFGGMLVALGGADFFNELGKIIGKYSKSGPAMTAVIASALLGMTTGQATPNIAVTGSFTIPLMKKVGYKPEVAASIEAAASGGAQITPPIMGAGAFVMADLLGIPYLDVVTFAIIPAFLYFFSVGMFVHLHAIKSNVLPLREPVNIKKLLATGPLFIVPLVAILTLLSLGYPPMLAAFWGVVVVVILSYVRKETRPPLRKVLEGCINGATTGAKVVVACATLGPIIALITKTGLGLKIGYSVEAWSGGNLLLGLVILMITVIILGLEVPTVAAYLMAALVAIPALVRMGLDPRQAHMFAFYFGAFSGLTPPVGMAAIVASRIAEAPYLRTAFHSINAAAAGFMVPFVFAFNGALVLVPGTSLVSLVISVIITMVGLAMFQMGFVGHFFNSLGAFERLMAIGGGLGFLFFAAVKNSVSLVVSSILLIALIIMMLHKKRKGRAYL